MVPPDICPRTPPLKLPLQTSIYTRTDLTLTLTAKPYPSAEQKSATEVFLGEGGQAEGGKCPYISI